MKFYEALSTNLGTRLNLDGAILALEEGLVTDRKAFRCPDDTCTAPLMINALPDPSGESKKREPYFTTAGMKKLHNTATCEYYLSDSNPSFRKRSRPCYEDDLKDITRDDVFDLNGRARLKKTTFNHPPIPSMEQVQWAAAKTCHTSHSWLLWRIDMKRWILTSWPIRG
jgi:hypothetical protein